MTSPPAPPSVLQSATPASTHSGATPTPDKASSGSGHRWALYAVIGGVAAVVGVAVVGGVLLLLRFQRRRGYEPIP
jgi:hypothetical protein